MDRKVRSTARRLLATLCLVLIGLGSQAQRAAATELVNDGWSDGQAAFFQEGFLAGEIGAARFVPAGPCPCFLREITLLYGGALQTRTVRLHIWDDGAGTPEPGVEIFTWDFELTGANDALQLIDLGAFGVFVNGPFRVGIEFLDDGLPAIARDDDGTIQADTNYIYADFGGIGLWAESGLFGLTGDWIIRATVEEQPSPVNELKNDSWPPTLTAHFQAGFAAGETAAVRLTPPGPCPCVINGVSVLVGGQAGQAEIGLRIWDDAALTDDPGTLLHSQDLQIPSAEATLYLVPLALEQIVVDGPFRLGFEMLNGGLPAVARDDDGITAGVNFIDEETLGWVEAGAQGLTGDWIMRAAVTNADLATAALGYDDWDALTLPAFQDGFAIGEIAAVRLEPDIPCPCVVQGVRLMFGGAAGDAPVTLRIWQDTGATAPGAEIYSTPLVLSANELALNAINLQSAGIVVNGPFRVGIEFGQAGAPSVARDHDGVLPGYNFIYDEGASWSDATTQGVAGDWIIRATIAPEVVLDDGFE